jgi:hypothetical protein
VATREVTFYILSLNAYEDKSNRFGSREACVKGASDSSSSRNAIQIQQSGGL